MKDWWLGQLKPVDQELEELSGLEKRFRWI